MPPTTERSIMSWNDFINIAIPSVLSAVVAWLWSTTKKVSKGDLEEATERIERDLADIRVQLRDYATKTELQVQLAAIQQSLSDLRELVRAALDKRA